MKKTLLFLSGICKFGAWCFVVMLAISLIWAGVFHSSPERYELIIGGVVWISTFAVGSFLFAVLAAGCDKKLIDKKQVDASKDRC